jgi:secondary thiamine-phosphate synthase enzyme
VGERAIPDSHGICEPFYGKVVSYAVRLLGPDEAVRRQVVACCLDYLGRLPKSDYDVDVLSEFGELPIGEIGVRVSISRGRGQDQAPSCPNPAGRQAAARLPLLLQRAGRADRRLEEPLGEERRDEAGCCESVRADELRERAAGSTLRPRWREEAREACPRMKSHRRVLTLNVPSRIGFVNITPDVQAAVTESGVKEGLCLVNPMHITASVFINDNEPGLHSDYERFFETLVPHEPVRQWRHNDTGEENADAHIKRQLMGREVVVAITNGKLDFGTWEQIFYGEWDGRRPKRILIKIIGG